MRNNPRGDWAIGDIETICAQLNKAGIDIEFRKPKRGSHHTVGHPEIADILTIPARRPIKTVYVKKFISIIDDIIKDEPN